MNATATPLKDVYLPYAVQSIEGRMHMMFFTDGTYQAFCDMPLGMEYEGTKYFKTGFNSDTGMVHYREEKSFARPLK